MARIQVLELPVVGVGEAWRTPFALVIDQAESAAVETIDGTQVRQVITEDFGVPGIKEASGAEFVIVTPHTLDVA
ncbi:hypothetical protein [Microbacterium sp. KR10-403]|uniref:hypothetical protein n=1 Tax=Microbacterium sp. KR10-403 TaxID=3158581 RepID=UPI0032E4E587